MEDFTIRDLTFCYPEKEKPALCQVNLEVKNQEFITLCGGSGSGKSTLLRHLKTVLTPYGIREGSVCFRGTPLAEVNLRTQAGEIGFVQQNPDNQIVTDKVWHELAFGLESLGASTAQIRRRVAEMASFFGIQTWFHKSVEELSGGQKQLLNLASVMVMQPSVLILDEPTSQLDPIAAADFLEAVQRINRDLGVTVILSEHRLEEALPMCDRAVVMEKGRVTAVGAPGEVGRQLKADQSDMFFAMPAAMRLFAAVSQGDQWDFDNCPLTVRQGREWLHAQLNEASGKRPDEMYQEDQDEPHRKPLHEAPQEDRIEALEKRPDEMYQEDQDEPHRKPLHEAPQENQTGVSGKGHPETSSKCLKFNPNFNLNGDAGRPQAVELSDLWFRYDSNGPDVVCGLSLNVAEGEFLAIVGGNGTGKSTALSLISGAKKPSRGHVKIGGRDLEQIPDGQLFGGLLGVLPQNPQALFVKKTVKEDLYEILWDRHLSNGEKKEQIERVTGLCRLENLLAMHPYDLSGGEQQRAALAKVLLLSPRILLLDEPTKGLDRSFQKELAEILKELQTGGATIIMVSHDVEFCAQYADRCALFFNGRITARKETGEFFAGNSFYTTAASRIARGTFPLAVTAEDVIASLLKVQDLRQKTDSKAPGHREDGSRAIDERSDTSRLAHLKAPGHREDGSRAIDERSDTLRLAHSKASGHWEDAHRAAADTSDISRLAQEPQAQKVSEIFRDERPEQPKKAERPEKVQQTKKAEQSPYSLEEFWKNHRPEMRRCDKKRRLPRRTIAALIMILTAVPLTIFIGVFYLSDRKYYFISLLIILETLLPFLMVFEGRKPKARETLILAVLSGIAVAGRAAFFMIPQFKPVMAVVIIAGVAFGGEAGFLVGAVTGFVSNFYFGQGPWTPWQMFSFGIAGFLAGILFRKGLLSRRKISLCIFGGLAAFFIYGGLMNPASVLMFYPRPTWPMFALAYLQGAPFDLIHAAATVVFLFFLSQPMLEKLDRIKIKYGLLAPGEEG